MKMIWEKTNSSGVVYKVWMSRDPPKNKKLRVLVNDRKTCVKLVKFAKNLGVKASQSHNSITHYIHVDEISDIITLRLCGERILLIEEFVVKEEDSQLKKF